MDIGLIIQARTSSKRLPSKVLKKLVDKSMLEHILFRLSFLKKKSKIVIATSYLKKDDKIEKFCIDNNVCCFRGSEKNVLQRLFLCSQEYNFRNIIRITGDNPFVDIGELDNLIDLHLKSKADYTTSLSVLPKGVGSEIFSFNALKKSYYLGKASNHKEHVNEYIEENEKMFKISTLCVVKNKNRPDISLTVDTKEDYEKACFIIKSSNNNFITTEEAIKFCLQFA